MKKKVKPRQPLHLGLLGSSGRMGQQIQSLVKSEFSQIHLAATAARGEDLTPLLLCSLVIDFSLPEALNAYLKLALRSRQKKLPALVSGTTGYSTETEKLLRQYAKIALVLRSFNFSIGVNALILCLQEISPALKAQGFSASLLETHHIHKKDKPSGTALMLQKSLSHFSPAETPITSLREGEVIGDHSVLFQHPQELVSFHHQALDRSIFARGALQVSLWLLSLSRNKNTGLLSMSDYLKAAQRKKT